MEKRWIISIDVPLWVSALGGGQADWPKLLSLLDESSAGENQLLYRDEIMQLAEMKPDNLWVLYSKLSKISTVGYPTDANSSYVGSNPDVTAGIGDPGQKAEVCHQMAYFYKRGRSVPRPVLAAERMSCNEIVLTKDGKNGRRVYVCGTSTGGVRKRIADLEPVLDQAKHFQFERNLGKGRAASTFSAYDRQDEGPAKALLRDAFLHYAGETLPADSLWAKDDAHGCYVHFRHSGQNKYHGYDETNPNKVPQEVRKALGGEY